MTTTTKYATWANVFGSLSLREDVNAYAGDFAADYDLDAIEADYRAAVAALLPGSMWLVGEEFIADVDDPEIPVGWADTLREDPLFTDGDEFAAMFDANPTNL
jgi:hypothetical protein